MKHTIDDTYIIRRSFSLLIIRLVLMELLLESVYVAWRIVIDVLPIGDVTKIYLHSLTTLVFIFVTLIQIVLLLIIVFTWANAYYEIQEDELIQWSGILTRKGRSYSYMNIQSITIEQSWFARLLGYGTVNLYIPALGQDIIFSEVPKPYAFIELIKKHIPKGVNQRFLIKRK